MGLRVWVFAPRRERAGNERRKRKQPPKIYLLSSSVFPVFLCFSVFFSFAPHLPVPPHSGLPFIPLFQSVGRELQSNSSCQSSVFPVFFLFHLFSFVQINLFMPFSTSHPFPFPNHSRSSYTLALPVSSFSSLLSSFLSRFRFSFPVRPISSSHPFPFSS